MKLSRLHALVGVCGLAVLSLSGCEVSNAFPANCTTTPSVPHNQFGTVGLTIDAPPQVEAGSTFSFHVNFVGIASGSGTPQLAPWGTIFVTGGATPSGNRSVGQFPNPATYPVFFQEQVTGQPGETIEIGLVSVRTVVGQNPDWYLYDCTVAGDGTLATLQIVEPS